MERKWGRLDSQNGLYVFSETQLKLAGACIDSWRTTTFWALMYMQSFLFDAKNIHNIGHELETQPAQYEIIFNHYYGQSFSSISHLSAETAPKYFKPFLTALKAGRGTEASEIRRSWLAEMRKASALFGAMNPFWDTAEFNSMLTHYVTLLCDSAENDILGKYQEIGTSYLVLCRLAGDLGEYMAMGIIRQFHIE